MNGNLARRHVWAATLTVLAMFAGGSLAQADRREGEPFHWNGRMPAGSTLEIHGVNGQIEVAPSSGPEIVVDAEKWSRHSNPDRVRIGIVRSRNLTVIRAIYPRQWFGTGSDDVNVHFTIRVPPKVELKLTTVNGSVEAVGLENRVAARTVNGGVHIDTAREAEAHTVNGSIVVRAMPRSGELHFRSINGSMRLEIPSQASVRLNARTLNGSITSDFPAARMRRGLIGRSYHGVIGDGDADLEVSTINGSIRVTRI
jgi:hypothetical protein